MEEEKKIQVSFLAALIMLYADLMVKMGKRFQAISKIRAALGIFVKIIEI